jgi:hypothetical protein
MQHDRHAADDQIAHLALRQRGKNQVKIAFGDCHGTMIAPQHAESKGRTESGKHGDAVAPPLLPALLQFGNGHGFFVGQPLP